MNNSLISIIVPMHNEAQNIRPLYKELTQHINKLAYRFEMIFVDDGSSDNSAQQVEKLTKKDRRVRLIEFARNFGKESAVTAGIHKAKGDAALILDADLQHPPELICEFIKEWRNGADVVVGVKRYDKAESIVKRMTSAGFYRVFRAVAQTQITPHASDYRLIDRKVIDAFNAMTERNRMTRGLIDWLGFQRSYIHFETAPRLHGKPSYNYRNLVKLAVNSITSYSMMPLKLAGYLGWTIMLTTIPLGIFVYVEQYLLGDPMKLHVTGTAFLGLLILVLVGIILVCLGLVALYIANIYEEVTNRPLYVIRRQNEVIDLDEEVNA